MVSLKSVPSTSVLSAGEVTRALWQCILARTYRAEITRADGANGNRLLLTAEEF